MSKHQPYVLAWVGFLGLAAIGGTALMVDPTRWTQDKLLALGVLTLCAAVANVFPIKSATDGVSYRLTNAFIMAGAVLLPPGLLAAMVALAIAPDLWVRRHRPRLLMGWIFNVSQTLLAGHTAGLFIHWANANQMSQVMDLVVVLFATALFTVAQAAMVGVLIVLDTGIPFSRVPTFSTPALLSDGLIAALGIAAAALWETRPVMLLLFPLLLIITHRMTRTAHLAHLAVVDTKTGLHNSRHFEAVLDEELAHSTRVGRPLALLFADLDHFKRVNDTYGHAAGDLVLRELSMLLSSLVRKGDIVARFGGEEFVAMLPGTDVDEAAFLGERVRKAVESHVFALEDGREVRCTISIGVASCPQDGTSVATLIQQADAAMYRAKQTRNAVARVQAAAPVPALNATVKATLGKSEPSAPQPRPPRSRWVPVILWSTVAAAAALLVWSVLGVIWAGDWLLLIPFLGVAVAAEFLQVQVYEASRQRISLSFTNAVMMAAVMVAPHGAPVVNLVAALLHVVVGRQRQLEKVLFNLANPVLAVGAASGMYVLLRPDTGGFTALHLAAALVATLTYYVVNVGTLSLMIAAASRRALMIVLRESVWFAPTNILLGLTGAFVGGANAQLGLIGVVMFVVPVLVLRFTLSFYARQTQRTIDTLQAAKTEVEQAHTEKEEILRKLIETVALIIDARDNSVSGHSRRVAKFAVAVGKELGMNPAELAVIHTAGLFHDLGKVGIPESILHKPARLTDEEYTVVQQHAGLGERLLSEVDQLSDIAQMVGEHHERYDGTGYPKRLKGENISLGGRILVVSDSLETMLADRPYSKGRTLPDALAELDRCSGSHFDPTVVQAVHRAVNNLGPDFFTGTERRPERDWGAADRILSEVFA